MVALNEIQELSRRIAEQFRPDRFTRLSKHFHLDKR